MTTPAESLSTPQDPHLERFYDYTRRVEEVRFKLLERLLGEDVILRGLDLHEISVKAIAQLSDEERKAYFSEPARELSRVPPLPDEVLSVTEDQIKSAASQHAGELHGFRLSEVSSARVEFSKIIKHQGNRFMSAFVLRPRPNGLEGEGMVIEFFDNAHISETVEPEELDADEALELVDRYVEYLKDLDELPMAQILQQLYSAA